MMNYATPSRAIAGLLTAAVVSLYACSAVAWERERLVPIVRALRQKLGVERGSLRPIVERMAEADRSRLEELVTHAPELHLVRDVSSTRSARSGHANPQGLRGTLTVIGPKPNNPKHALSFMFDLDDGRVTRKPRQTTPAEVVAGMLRRNAGLAHELVSFGGLETTSTMAVADPLAEAQARADRYDAAISGNRERNVAHTALIEARGKDNRKSWVRLVHSAVKRAVTSSNPADQVTGLRKMLELGRGRLLRQQKTYMDHTIAAIYDSFVPDGETGDRALEAMRPEVKDLLRALMTSIDDEAEASETERDSVATESPHEAPRSRRPHRSPTGDRFGAGVDFDDELDGSPFGRLGLDDVNDVLRR